jgi:hypothetical protein
VDDTEADLRGSVSLEDREIGEYNAVVVPVGRRGGRDDILLAFCVYLPIPSRFDAEFARMLAKKIELLGMKLAFVLETAHDANFFRIVRGAVRSSPGNPDRPLKESLRQLLERYAHTAGASPGVLNSTDEAEAATGFPWVALMDFGPELGNPERGQDQQLLEAWVEPSSFFRARVNSALHEFISGQANRPVRQLAAHANGVAFTESLWEERLVVLTFPFSCTRNGVRSVAGVLRVMLGRDDLGREFGRRGLPDFLANLNERLKIQLEDNRLCLHLSKALEVMGDFVFQVRELGVDSPVGPYGLKLVRECERLLFEAILDAMLNPDVLAARLKKEGKTAHKLFEHILLSILADIHPEEDVEKWKERSADTSYQIDRLVCSFRMIVAGLCHERRTRTGQPLILCRPGVPSECPDRLGIFAATYWSFDKEMVLAGDPPPECADKRHLLRDLQQALGHLAGARKWDHWPRVVQWKDTGETGKLTLNTDTAHVCYLHLPWTSEPWKGNDGKGRYDTMSISRTGDPANGRMPLSVSFTRGEDTTGALTSAWTLDESFPLIRAWRVRQAPADKTATSPAPSSPIKRYLDSKRRYDPNANPVLDTLCDLRPPWNPADGIRAGEAALRCSWDRPNRESLDEVEEEGKRRQATADERAMYRLLRAQAQDEVDTLHRIWAIPVQVLDHVYFYLLVGTRRANLDEDDQFRLDPPEGYAEGTVFQTVPPLTPIQKKDK